MTPDDTDRPPSKSQRKRDMLALQALAKRLVELPESRTDALPLNDALREGLTAARGMQRAALKRQIRYLGGQLALIDAAAVERALETLDRPHVEDVRAFHEVEQWRDALVAGDDAPLELILARHPGADRRQLTALVRAARNEAGRTPAASRALFRFLRGLREDD